ncbi:hypothetical protein C5167_008021 [Papaver somniferum]|uniref:Uncharacterized protein n=1 Tax=Papaver somniferum TaxID=3469 RepID=A0A4Y7JX29_PAPSO|nr:hypothetical protein C5167_008021 [Papaver somniferum]
MSTEEPKTRKRKTVELRTKNRHDAETMARRVNKVFTKFYTPTGVDVNKFKVKPHPKWTITRRK